MPAPDRGTQPRTAPPPAAPPRIAQLGPGTSGGVLTLLLTSVAFFMVTLDALVVVTALPSIHRDLGGGISTLQWTVSAYTIAFGAGILTAAALGDRLGRKRVFAAGLALFTAASAACALAPNTTALITFRAFQGIVSSARSWRTPQPVTCGSPGRTGQAGCEPSRSIWRIRRLLPMARPRRRMR